MKRIIFILFFITTLTNISLAQKFTASASKTKVAVGETFQISFSLNTNGSNFKAPNLNDFEVYSGPNQSSSMSLVNGVMSQSISLSYILSPKREGKFTVGPASVIINGATVQSNALIIEVSKGNQNANQQNGNQNNDQNASAGSNNKILIKAITNKSKAFVGEEVAVTFKLYFNAEIAQQPNLTVMPSFDGFYLQDGKTEQKQTIEIIDGVRYIVVDIKKTFAIPQHAGKLTIDPMELECVIRQQSNRQPRNIIEQMMGVPYENIPLKVRSKPITIDVSPLPETNKPVDFSGAVGDYTYKVELSKDRVKANEAVNLTVTLSGKGNIKLIDAPKIKFPEDFESYDPKVKDNISAGTSGVSGGKTFDYLLIPRHEGDYKINDLNFTFFNPAKNEYITIPSPELLIHVDKGDPNNASANIYTPTTKDDVKILGNDIRYIKTGDPNLRSKNNYFFGSPLFYTGIISPFLAFIGFLFFRRKTMELNKDQIALKSRKATKMAKKRLSIAEKNLKENNKELFYMEISQALFGYLGDKLNIAGANLNRENIFNILKNRSISDNTSSQLLSTLDNCEYARYAPSAVSGDLNLIYNNTVELITKIENEIR